MIYLLLLAAASAFPPAEAPVSPAALGFPKAVLAGSQANPPPDYVRLAAGRAAELVKGGLRARLVEFRNDAGAVSYSVRVENPTRQPTSQRVTIRFFDSGYRTEYGKLPQFKDVSLKSGESADISGTVHLESLPDAKKVQRVAATLEAPSAPPKSDPVRAAASAKVVHMLAAKGDRISAGPYSLLIDPKTNAITREVVANPESQDLIPALHRNPNTGKVSMYFLKPVDGNADRARHRCFGDGMLAVVPDDLGNRDIKKRAFWVDGQSRAGRFVRQVSYYEVVAYTARDSLLDVTGFGTSAQGSFVPEKISWSDKPGDVRQVDTAGWSIGMPRTPGTVKVGQTYEVLVPITITGGGRLYVRCQTPNATPQVQEKIAQSSGDLTFQVQATQPGVIQSIVNVQEVTPVANAVPTDTIGIRDPRDPVDVPPNTIAPPGINRRTTGGRAWLSQNGPFVFGGIGALLSLHRTRTEDQTEIAVPRVELGDETELQIATTVAALDDNPINCNDQDAKTCPATIKDVHVRGDVRLVRLPRDEPALRQGVPELHGQGRQGTVQV